MRGASEWTTELAGTKTITSSWQRRLPESKQDGSRYLSKVLVSSIDLASLRPWKKLIIQGEK